MTRWARLPSHLQQPAAKPKAARVPREPSELEETFAGHVHVCGMALGSVRELVFAPPRRWRFDFAWPDEKVAVEIEGGVWADGAGKVGRHLTGKGFEDDCEKYNEAAIRGWLVLRLPGKLVESGAGVSLLERALQERRTVRH